jgi:hypothetical protein
MSQMTDLTALRERYSPKPVPKCHICGAEMTVQRMSASRITYGCTGATYDDTGCHYAEGRSIADDHYEQSRVTIVDVSDPDVLAMLDEREAAKQDSARWFKAFKKAVSIGARYEERIAELEANKGKPVMFIDGDISASDAEKLAAVIREWEDVPAPVVPDEMETRELAAEVELPDVEKWRSVDAVRAQNAYKVLVSKVLAAAGICVKGN